MTIDLSRVPPPTALKASSFETLFDQYIERFLARWNELREGDATLPAYDVETLKSDPASVIGHVTIFMRLIDHGRINDAVKAGLIAFAIGSDLEHLAAYYGLSRRTLTPAIGSTPAVLEPDFELRRRVLLAPEAFSTAGSHGAYVFHALGADVEVINADVWSPAPGEVIVAVQSRTGDGAASAHLVERVRAHLSRGDVKPLTDILSVRSVVVRPYRIEVEGFVLPGPDAATVRNAMTTALAAMAENRRTPSRDVPRSAVYGAAQVGPVDRVVVHSPANDIATARGELAVLTGIDVKVSTYGG